MHRVKRAMSFITSSIMKERQSLISPSAPMNPYFSRFLAGFIENIL
jgi:hypothetical protein